MEENSVIEERKEKIKNFFRINYNWIAYLILATIIFLAARIRSSNISRLKDITTGSWTLGPDLDPFLFLRWSKYIVENGSLFTIDTMRYAPLGAATTEEYLLHPYMMAWFHNVLSFFGLSDSVTYSAILYPVFFFALALVAFFFLTKEIFRYQLGDKKANIIGLLATFFLSVFPVLLPRTIAGIPEKEAAALFFFFTAFYFFLSSWNSKTNIKRYSLAVLAAISTAAMANIWGGYIFIFVGIAPTVFIAFLLGKVGKKESQTYATWLLFSIFMLLFFSSRLEPLDLLYNMYTLSSLIVFLIILVHFFFYNTRLKKYFEKDYLTKFPPRFISIIASFLVLFILALILLGPDFISAEISAVKDNLIKPATSRLIQTVAENKQPYFTEWSQSFGPDLRGFPVTFWLFFIGSIYLFYSLVSELHKKDRIVFILSYIYFLSALIFTRYSGSSKFNGENFISVAVYFSGFAIFLFAICFYYYNYYKNNELSKFEKINFNIMFIFVLSIFSILGARGLIRLVMIMVIPISIVISYLAVSVFYDFRNKKESWKLLSWIIILLVLFLTLFSGYNLYKQISSDAQGYAPATYNQQWQKAMAWVRDNTQKNSVFAHWWDYGYWIQSIGERATVLDGGNLRSFWNHLMGRYALTGTDNNLALEFLYAHNVTHFLIDSTDIGKYSAFSYIGSNEKLDRRSYIQTFLKDPSQTREAKNTTIYFYVGATGLDEDIIYESNGTKIFLPENKAGLGAILIERDSQGNIANQPTGLFVYNNQQYNLPFRYAFDSEFKDFGSGIEAGVYIFPSATFSNGNLQGIDPEGALFYLSKRTVKSQLARLYLYEENNPYFKLVHEEEDYIVEAIKVQNPQFKSDFIYLNGFRGPIKIWEVNYPSDIEFKEEYLSIEYPRELRFG